MKKLFILLISLLSLALDAQTYRPFPTGDAYWTTERLDDFWQPTGQYTIYKQQGDTILYTLSYNKLYVRCHFCPSFEYKGALREDNKKIYYFPKDSIQEYLLYDFDVQVGDTVINLYSEWNGPYENDTLIIEYIDNGYYQLLGLGYHIIIYEGIGSVEGPIQKAYEGSVSGGDVLRCFSDSAGMVYNNNGPCLTGVLETAIITMPDIYPTPTNNVLYFKGSHNFQTVKIINASGNIVLTQAINSNTGEVTITHLPDGLYIIELIGNGKTYRKKLVKI